jgi:hypothetical protein
MSKSIGACYLISQAPGGERLGGLQITLIVSREKAGTLELEPTDYFTGQPFTEDMRWLLKLAEEGIHDYAKEHSVDLSSFKIIVSKIAYHPVDSFPYLYYQAAQSALRAALEAWSFRRFD